MPTLHQAKNEFYRQSKRKKIGENICFEVDKEKGGKSMWDMTNEKWRNNVQNRIFAFDREICLQFIMEFLSGNRSTFVL